MALKYTLIFKLKLTVFQILQNFLNFIKISFATICEMIIKFNLRLSAFKSLYISRT